MQNDLISKGGLLERIEQSRKAHRAVRSRLTVGDMEQMIKSSQPVDAAPVRHGRWLDTHEYDPFTGIYKCSECGFFTTMTTGSLVDGRKDNYCPNCGAKMDAEVQE